MKHIKVALLVVVLAMVASACSLFGGDDETDLSTAETFTPEPTANVVQAVPAQGADAGTEPTVEAGAPLPTAVTIPTAAATPEPTPDRSQPTTYVVQAGDVLGLIAERFDVDIAELRRVNDLSGNLIRVGQTLTIPALDGSTDTDEDEDDETASGPVGSSQPSTPRPTSEPVSCGANAVGHCVQSGDSLLGIASTYGVTVDALRAANPSIVGDLIKIGELLTIPGQTTGGSSGGTTGGGTTATATPDLSPKSDADCRALNPAFPFYHAPDGLCYANPIGSGGSSTPAPTSGSVPGDATFQGLVIPAGQECPDSAPLYGQFVKDGAIVDGPACYPTLAAVVPTPTVRATTTSTGSTSPNYGTAPCLEPYFVASSTGRCFLTTEGENAGYGGAGTPVPTATP